MEHKEGLFISWENASAIMGKCIGHNLKAAVHHFMGVICLQGKTAASRLLEHKNP